MKLNISNPNGSGASKKIVIEDESKLRVFYDKPIGEDVDGEGIGEEFNGYVFRIRGGIDKQGFPMKPGILTNTRLRLLLKKNTVGYRGFTRRRGERRKKSVRGAIVSPDIALLNLMIIKKGEHELPGITDVPPKVQKVPTRTNLIRQFFGLDKRENITPYIEQLRAKLTKEDKSALRKLKRIQRLQSVGKKSLKQKYYKKKAFRKAKYKKELTAYKELILQRKNEAIAKMKTERASAERRSSRKISELKKKALLESQSKTKDETKKPVAKKTEKVEVEKKKPQQEKKKKKQETEAKSKVTEKKAETKAGKRRLRRIKE